MPPTAAGKLIELEYAGIEDRKVRSQLRSATDLEVKVRGGGQSPVFRGYFLTVCCPSCACQF